MNKCQYFSPNKLGCRVNCANCKRWTGTECKIELQLFNRYEDTVEFKFYNRLMRENKGVNGPL
ncbi:hypothetical protein Desaci_1287 [Desulfosporosinus acidiphilus SJ4]|uniref:Uncharacterized protein n=1 Tax=Desulfosporosinus acidiphilus (strain DSM 22704 / JCM 16185 / SJ4) TaxID=646529 RepID=I4D3D9_DESAJ|nr:hypothetical protein Desaci_1287 [Desulfosporosinus acidiphilus SJ4]